MSKNIDHVVPLREPVRIMLDVLLEHVLVLGTEHGGEVLRETGQPERSRSASRRISIYLVNYSELPM